MRKVRHITTGPTAALGHADRSGCSKIAVQFHDDLFEAIRARAIREGTSFAEQVRLLCEWGLESAESAE